MAEGFGCDGGEIAQRFVRYVFREEQVGVGAARHVFGVMEFDEKVVEPVSVVEHRMKPNNDEGGITCQTYVFKWTYNSAMTR